MNTETLIIPGAFGLSSGITLNQIKYDLTIGEPHLSHFPTEFIDDLKNIKNIHQYYSSLGDIELRNKIRNKFYKNLSTENIVITHGAIGAIDVIFRAMLTADSNILIPNPGFPPYEQLAKFANAKILKYKINFNDNQCQIDWEQLRSLVNHETKLILINTPHNPTGRVFTKVDKSELIKLLNDFPQLSFLVDEVYRELIFTEDICLDFADIIERGFIVGSFSKIYPLQGARVGWLATNQGNLNLIVPYLNNAYGAISSFGQELAKTFINNNLSYQDVYCFSKNNTKEILDNLKIKYVDPQGAIYFFIYIGADVNFKVQLLKERGVFVIPGRNFGSHGENYIRICFAHPHDHIKAALEIIAEIISIDSLGIDQDVAVKVSGEKC